jgi:AraC family transcriptional regulator
MSRALQILQGSFGRVALLDMTHSLVAHAHPHCHVLIKISGSDAAFRLRGRAHPLADNTLILVNAWEPHSYLHMDPSAHTVILALYIDPQWLAACDRAFAASGDPHFFSHACAPMTPRIRAAANRLMAVLSEQDVASERKLAGVYEIMAAVIERFSLWRELQGGCLSGWKPADFRVRKAMNFMQERVGSAFTLGEVARASGLSRSHLFHVFQEHLNLSPRLYFNALRVEAAVSKLASDQRPLAHLSRDLGFSVPSHFTRFCRNNLGVSPSEYRNAVTLSGAAQGPQAAELSNFRLQDKH